MFQGSLRIVRVALDHFEMLEGAFDGFHFVWGTRVTPFSGSIPCFSDRKMTNLLSICNPAGFRNKAIRSVDVGLNLFVCWHIGQYLHSQGVSSYKRIGSPSELSTEIKIRSFQVSFSAVSLSQLLT